MTDDSHDLLKDLPAEDQELIAAFVSRLDRFDAINNALQKLRPHFEAGMIKSPNNLHNFSLDTDAECFKHFVQSLHEIKDGKIDVHVALSDAILLSLNKNVKILGLHGDFAAQAAKGIILKQLEELISEITTETDIPLVENRSFDGNQLGLSERLEQAVAQRNVVMHVALAGSPSTLIPEAGSPPFSISEYNDARLNRSNQAAYEKNIEFLKTHYPDFETMSSALNAVIAGLEETGKGYIHQNIKPLERELGRARRDGFAPLLKVVRDFALDEQSSEKINPVEVRENFEIILTTLKQLCGKDKFGVDFSQNVNDNIKTNAQIFLDTMKNSGLDPLVLEEASVRRLADHITKHIHDFPARQVSRIQESLAISLKNKGDIRVLSPGTVAVVDHNGNVGFVSGHQAELFARAAGLKSEPVGFARGAGAAGS